MNHMRTIVVLSSLSSLRARKAARQIELPSWEAGNDCRLVGSAVAFPYIRDEMSKHGYTPIPAGSDWARVLMELTDMEVVRVRHEEGDKTWVIPAGAHINVGGYQMAI